MSAKLKKAIIIALFVLAFLIRLYNFDYPIANQEVHVQYLISSHIVKFAEYPLVGYLNTTFPSLGTSPAYNYLLAIPILIFNNLMFVNLINFVLQILSIYILFKIAKNIFGEKTAIIALVFMSFTSVLISQAEWMWPPHLMFFFVTLSFYYLYKTYEDKKNKNLLISSGFFALSVSIHMLTITLLPFYLASVYLIYKKHAFKHALKYFAWSTIFTIFLYLPLIFHHGRYNSTPLTSLSDKLTTSGMEYYANFNSYFIAFFESLNLGAFSILIIGLLILLYFILGKEKSEQKIVSILLILAVLSPILGISFFSDNFLPQHFTAVYPLFFLVLASFLANLLKSHPSSKIFSLLLIVFFAFKLTGVNKLQYRRPLIKLPIHNKLEEAILQTAEDVGEDSFQFKLYTSDSIDRKATDIWFFDTLFWPSLEKTFDKKLVKVVENKRGYWYEEITSNKYLFVGCYGYNNKDECTNKFLRSNRNYSIEKVIIKDVDKYDFYLAKKK